MKTFSMEQRSPEWFEEKKGVVSGTVLKDIVGTPYMRKKTFYKMVAERLSVGEMSEEIAMQRGVRLEDEARAAYSEESGNKVVVFGFTKHDQNKYMGESPDGLVEIDGKYRGALEIKCLGSDNHVKAKLENKIPEEYEPQVIQKFIINEDLEWVDFVMWDPRITVFPYLKFRIDRADVEETIADYKQREEEFIKEVNEAVKNLIMS